MEENENKNNPASKLWNGLIGKLQTVLRSVIDVVNDWFNSLSVKMKQAVLLLFGMVIGGCSLMLIVQALQKQQTNYAIEIENIKTPEDIFMKEHNEPLSDEQLIPVGKMKGEVAGEFDAFYVGVDRKGEIYINRDIEYTEDAYNKTKGWEPISREKLKEYENALHFIPFKSRGIKP